MRIFQCCLIVGFSYNAHETKHTTSMVCIIYANIMCSRILAMLWSQGFMVWSYYPRMMITSN